MRPGLVPSRLTLRGRQESALAPVRTALLRDAAAEADRMLADARQAADALLEQARADAVSAVSQAREEGRTLAAPLALAELSRGRREASTTLLNAELRARAELEGRIRAAIRGLRDQPGYGELLERLSELARRAAGPGATVSEHSAGGAIARRPGVLVDCSLPRLADRVIAALGQQIRELTAP
jgi:vacuolar-type H+-ATPase subunit E/Vma4